MRGTMVPVMNLYPTEVQRPAAPDAKPILDAILARVPTGITIAFGPQALVHSVSHYGLQLMARDDAEVQRTGAERHPAAWQLFNRDGRTLTRPEALPLTRACAGETVQAEELFLMSSTGKLIPILCHAGPIQDPGGAVIGGITAWHEVAPLNDALARHAALVDEAQAARRTAETATAAKSDLMAKVAHELRDPLSAVLGWTRIARSSLADPVEAAKALDVIERNARLQARIVEDLLDLNAAQSGQLQVNLLAVALHEVVQSAADSTRPLAQAKGVEIAVALEAVCVSGDPARLQQIVTNLLTNAVKFAPVGSRVKVQLLAQGGRAVLKVTDAGIGMSAQQCAQAFEPFWQARGGGEGGVGSGAGGAGLGLGLAICRSLAHAHAGQISVHSEGLGSGCCFTVDLPLKE